MDHLSAKALRNYASVLGPAFAPGLRGSQSALFCDSFEIVKGRLWNPALWSRFEMRFHYSLKAFADDLDTQLDVRYDYRKFISETIVREFFACFTDICHELGAVSRVQCHGAPADLLSAYSTADIPESEALLFEPHFSRIAASAAALSNKPVVSSETFTCIYGFPSRFDSKCLLYRRNENVADLKLLADALFANGINQIVWHGMPFNPPGGRNEFYASVHVGPDCAFLDDLKPFNAYLERVSAALRQGVPFSRLAVYLPNEDYMMLELPPPDNRVPAEQDYWEMRRVVVPAETEGYHPLWVSEALLKRAEVTDGCLVFNRMVMPALYVDVDWLDADALCELLRLAHAGLRLVMKREPQQPGRVKSIRYKNDLEELRSLPTVVNSLEKLDVRPLLVGHVLPWFWVREVENGLLIFVAHPRARGVRYPMRYGQSSEAVAEQRNLILDYGGKRVNLRLNFGAFESLLVSVDCAGLVSFEDLSYIPPIPQQDV